MLVCVCPVGKPQRQGFSDQGSFFIIVFCECRYNGREGYVPATYLMKSEAFSMKKPKVTRTSVGGPEIVKTLHDISDLLKVSFPSK